MNGVMAPTLVDRGSLVDQPRVPDIAGVPRGEFPQLEYANRPTSSRDRRQRTTAEPTTAGGTPGYLVGVEGVIVSPLPDLGPQAKHSRAHEFGRVEVRNYSTVGVDRGQV